MMIEALNRAQPKKGNVMNTTQLQTTLAPIVSFIAGFLAARNIFGFDAATWITILTGIGGLATAIWAAIATRKTAMVSTVAAMPEVSKVELDRSVAGASALEAATPANVTAK